MRRPTEPCETEGCPRTAAASVHLGRKLGARRYCARCADAVAAGADQPILVMADRPGAGRPTSLAGDPERIIAIGCRDCGDRLPLADGQPIPVRCRACGSHGKSCRRH